MGQLRHIWKFGRSAFYEGQCFHQQPCVRLKSLSITCIPFVTPNHQLNASTWLQGEIPCISCSLFHLHCLSTCSLLSNNEFINNSHQNDSPLVFWVLHLCTNTEHRHKTPMRQTYLTVWPLQLFNQAVTIWRDIDLKSSLFSSNVLPIGSLSYPSLPSNRFSVSTACLFMTCVSASLSASLSVALGVAVLYSMIESVHPPRAFCGS